MQAVTYKSCVWTVLTCSYLKSVTVYKEYFLGGGTTTVYGNVCGLFSVTHSIFKVDIQVFCSHTSFLYMLISVPFGLAGTKMAKRSPLACKRRSDVLI